MKNEELFDLITQLKVDDEYIEEALTDDFDSRTVKAYAGKTKLTPMKMIAPVAACLAVAAAVGFVFSNKDKFAITPADSASTQSGDRALSEEEFIEQCMSIVSGESELITQNETTWQTSRLDVDFDGDDEFLIYPQIDEKTVAEIGVRVFRKTENGAEDLGSFGKESDRIDLNGIRKDERDGVVDQYYYLSSHNDRYYVYDGIRFVCYNEEENAVNDDKCLMRETDKLWGEVTTFIDGQSGGSKLHFFHMIREFPDDIAETFCEFTNSEIAKCEKDALTRNGKLELEELLTPGMWHSGEYDINGDGETELLISLFHFTNMRGVFVYDKNCEYLGSFETENGLCSPEALNLYENGEKRYWYFSGAEGMHKHDNGLYSGRLEKVSINKIIVENNNFSTERLMHCDLIWDWDNDVITDSVYWIGDKEVGKSEFMEASAPYIIGGMASHEFDLNDPEDWEFVSKFEDSEITIVNIPPLKIN